MQTYKILFFFLICCAISAALFIPSLNFLSGSAAGCAMSLGCSGRSTGVVDILAVFGLLSPIAIFPAGAIFTSKNLSKTSKSGIQKTLLVLFGLFPFIAVAAMPVFFIVADTASTRSNRASRERVEKIDKELRSAPIEVSVIKARLIEGTGKEREIEFTIQVKNVPQIVQKYRFTLESLNLKYPILGIYQDETPVYTPVVKAVNENGKWEFQAYQSGKVLTSGEDQFVARIRYLKGDEPPGSDKSREEPETLNPRLEYWYNEEQSYPELKLFIRSVPIRGYETGRL